MMRFTDPLREFDQLRREVDRAFSNLGIDARFRNAFLPGRAARAYPLVKMWGDADKVVVEALAPGVSPDTFEINILRNQLTVSGEKSRTPENIKPEQYHRSERAAARFVRTLALPSEVDDTRVTAEYRNGILRLTLPKVEAAKPKKITVKAA
jgi:HSP20 family protein